MVRFDRTPCLGRRGMVSLDAVSNEFVGHNKAWDEQAQSLLALKKISRADYQTMLQVFAFGRLMLTKICTMAILVSFWRMIFRCL